MMTEHNAYFITIHGRENFPSTMTKEEEQIMQEHFLCLKGLTEINKLILAGRNLENDFGYIILKIESLDETKALMDDDPSVKSGVMNPTFYPFRVALLNCK